MIRSFWFWGWFWFSSIMTVGWILGTVDALSYR